MTFWRDITTRHGIITIYLATAHRKSHNRKSSSCTIPLLLQVLLKLPNVFILVRALAFDARTGFVVFHKSLTNSKWIEMSPRNSDNLERVPER